MIALLYHDVIADALANESGFPGPDANHYKLSPDVFQAHLMAVPSNAANVLFTFDDGGASALDPCADLLESSGVRGLFFVPSDWIGHAGFSTASDLRTLHHRGHMVGSHSASHPVPISALSDSQLAREWQVSRERLEQVLGAAVTDASVPGGFTSSRVEAAAAEAGYTRLFTSQPRRSERTVSGMKVFGRFSVTRSTSLDTVSKVLAGDGLPWTRQAVL